MILTDLGMLLAISPRSKAYVQALVRVGLHPSHVIIMEDGSDVVAPGQVKNDLLHRDQTRKKSRDLGDSRRYSFDMNEPLIDTLNGAGIPYEICPTKDVNSILVIDTLKRRGEKYFIYSGIGGALLRDEILGLGKMFLHVHPGRVPDFRGSTTIYYSILEEDSSGATAFFLDRNIDTGDVTGIKEFGKPEDGTTIDYVYDPAIRAELLTEVIQEYARTGQFKIQKQDKGGGETYFIIHPLLKHIAILSCAG